MTTPDVLHLLTCAGALTLVKGMHDTAMPDKLGHCLGTASLAKPRKV